ncbi:nitric oxide reductase transcriptional regulator NorR [Coralloluteibacterium stylophorae]|uniref:Nitric oxide reductase transcriptional regulator NorR n=1 Tax=Coralloluteibacterium stylophorae TaxID=1776034 RepID=A0A8J7VTL8_9GAMM|nr:nitric oxide reductase transcriptional regulator NorR [Coralloluteibacterium stylophorae]MBS7456011.1 nitric oxide reductase transcriptional regulator NorR [Coralloluteibacterium stylophorae]
MTRPRQLAALLPLMADLAQDLPDAERYRRLLQGLRALLPSDAAALLRLDGDSLVPLAVDGLTADTLGRRFRVADHPRFEILLQHAGPVRFEADSPLPDPYDGLVEGLHGHLPVHDCLGCVLRVHDRPWGLLTLDALEGDRFSAVELDLLQAFASLASASVAVAARIHQLAEQAELARASGDAGGEPPRRRLIGAGAAHRQLQREIELAGPSDLCVLIQGETGVGKELVAQALHAASARAGRRMVSVNCAALPDTLVESELFGHVRGAFTGAGADRRGRFELADGGTLFLDEVGELPLATQAKLLRALQDGHVQRLGSDREHCVDVRVIAASNRDLADEVRRGRLRADFYHRLSVYPLHVPPLRVRGRDVLMIAGGFLEEARSRLGLGGLRLDPPAQAALLGYDWPGNVRELEHVIGRAVVKALGRQPQRPRIVTVTAADLSLVPGVDAAPPPAAGAPEPPALGLRQAVDAYEEGLIRETLERHGYRWAAAARALRVDRANLARSARRLGIAPPPKR